MAVAGAWLACGIVIARQDPQPTFRGGVNAVSLNVVVKDSRGRAIRNLAGADFQVFDQGRAVQLSDFRLGEGPVSVAILIDTSGSMRIGTRLDQAKIAAKTVLEQFRPGDEAALFAFDRTLDEIVLFSSNIPALWRGVESVDAFGSTALHDAVAAAARRLAERPTGRRAVIAITDGLDTSSELSAATAARVASSIDVPVYVLAIANTSGPVDPKTISLEPVLGGGVARLDDLTAHTGGATFAAETSIEASLAVRQILADVRAAYLMAFTPDPTPGWHPLTVRVARKNAHVRTRAGFWMSGPPY